MNSRADVAADEMPVIAVAADLSAGTDGGIRPPRAFQSSNTTVGKALVCAAELNDPTHRGQVSVRSI